MLILHNIIGCEIESRDQLLPGYAALKLGAPKRWRWQWWHPTLLITVATFALLIAADRGMLP